MERKKEGGKERGRKGEGGTESRRERKGDEREAGGRRERKMANLKPNLVFC